MCDLFCKFAEILFYIVKLSIIIPVYNISAYLEECVQSVFRQTFTDYEVILVDDGSLDGSAALCDEIAMRWKQKYGVKSQEQVRVIHKENGGLSDARNAGLLEARGEYIHFLDGDDYYTTEKDLGSLVDALDTLGRPDTLLFCRRDIYESRTKNQELRIHDERPYDTEFINSCESPTEIFRHLLTTQRFNMSACFQLLRREMLIEHEIFFTKGLLSEDVDWNLALWQKIRTVKAINCLAYSYRHRAASISTSLSIRNYKSYEYMFSKWTGILEKELRAKNQEIEIKNTERGSKEKEELAQLQLTYLAFLYPTLLYGYYTLPKQDRREACKMLREMRYVLRYSNTKKSNRVCKSMRHLGFYITLNLFATYAWLKRQLR